MSNMDMQLHDYLINNLCAISDEWLAQRIEEKGSIYSVDAGETAETKLREQNRLTNLAVASSLLGEQGDFEKNKEQWALIVAKSRVSSNTPIHEVLDALSKVRKTYWSFIVKFVELKGDEVTRADLLKWGITIHEAFDRLTVSFSEMYYQVMDNRLSAQLQLIEELGTPIIKVNESVGVLPLVGDIDTLRAQKFLEDVPARCTEQHIEHLFIDLSGVSIIDTMVAHQIFRSTQILKLLGIKSTITGIRPEIAQTAVQLGLNFSQIDTFSSLQQALENGFRIIKDK
ncbi:STAS domain-containing protein [Filibacter tadaridae]|uniref:RsbT co-antagonist protein RsbRD n=1 Tax=Filibacter tadaridae TaxID=2483811 RepID=A0A3P5WTW4_9BACL|nr:STAS domain-containing protein [Filibacter tadaridae]VDC22630.1 RsbT co-antagonist protein RsbRD [Filibacter tadaridae]